MQTTSTPALAASGASGSVAVTAAGVPAGTSGLPVYAGPANPAQVGIYIAASPDFQGNWSLYQRGSGFRADPAGIPQIVTTGDNISLAFASTAALANLSGMDLVSLVVTARTAGTIALAVVQ